MRVPIIYMVGRGVCSHRPHDYLEVRMPRHPELQGVTVVPVGDTGGRPSTRAGDTSEWEYDDYE